MKAVKLSAAILALGLVASPLAAQLAGQPVYAIPKGVGLGLNADFGMQLDPSVTGGSNNLAVRATLGLPMIKVTAAFQPKMLDAGESAIMGGASFALMPAPVSVRIQATAGYGMTAKNLVAVPGVVIGLNVPSPMLSIEPYVMPSLRYTHFNGGGSNTAVGVSAGVNLGLPGGLGGHVALDYARFSIAGVTSHAVTGGIGIHYMLSVPGLGMM